MEEHITKTLIELPFSFMEAIILFCNYLSINTVYSSLLKNLVQQENLALITNK